jgi:hypothetical protein
MDPSSRLVGYPAAMETLKLVVVLGVLAAAFAIGLAHLMAAVTGGEVTGDEMARHAFLSFVLMGAAVPIVRRRGPR